MKKKKSLNLFSTIVAKKKMSVLKLYLGINVIFGIKQKKKLMYFILKCWVFKKK